MSEDLGFLFALLLNGVSIGLMYSLIALGFVLVYKATDAINFAQGEFVMLAGLIVALALSYAGMPLIGAIGITLATMIAFGFGLERVVLRPLLGRPVVAVIMATIGLAAMLRGLGPVIFAPVFRWLLETQGWQRAFQLIGSLLGCVFGFFALFIYNSPADKGMQPYGIEDAPKVQQTAAEAAAPPVRLRDILKMPIVWKLFGIHHVG